MLQTPRYWIESKDRFPFKFDDSAFASAQPPGGDEELHFTTDGSGVLYEYDVVKRAELKSMIESPGDSISTDNNAPLAAAAHRVNGEVCVVSLSDPVTRILDTKLTGINCSVALRSTSFISCSPIIRWEWPASALREVQPGHTA